VIKELGANNIAFAKIPQKNFAFPILIASSTDDLDTQSPVALATIPQKNREFSNFSTKITQKQLLSRQ